MVDEDHLSKVMKAVRNAGPGDMIFQDEDLRLSGAGKSGMAVSVEKVWNDNLPVVEEGVRRRSWKDYAKAVIVILIIGFLLVVPSIWPELMFYEGPFPPGIAPGWCP